MKILIIDDELLLAMDLHDLLRNAGYDVIGYAPAVEPALTIARGLPPALALVDINLRGNFEGIGLARDLKERYGTEIIFVTAYTEPVILDRARAVVPAAILHKPLNYRELFDAIDTAAAGVGAHPPVHAGT